MGRVFRVYFDDDRTYCWCKACETHIALMGDFFRFATHIFPEEPGHLLRKVVNVQVDEPVHYERVGIYTVAGIYCVNCGNHLGWKCIQVDRDCGQDPPHDALKEGNVKLIGRRIKH